MNNQEKINALEQLGNYLLNNKEEYQSIINEAYLKNPWFTKENCQLAIEAIAKAFLNATLLKQWLSQYKTANSNKKVVGLVLAGNIPLVGFHDILCVLMSDNIAQIKLSSKDDVLLPFILSKLVKIDVQFKEQFMFVPRLNQFDAIIATGSNSTALHFEQYFGKYPHIIRKNRNSVAIINDETTIENLQALGNDVFSFFGMGCRNVSKIYVPKNFEFSILNKAWDTLYGDVMLHHKYKNNLDYQRTVYLMTSTPLVDIDFINIIENNQILSPIACLYYEYYDSIDTLNEQLLLKSDEIQCIVGTNHIAFGNAQMPTLNDYADGIDTMQFLLRL